MNHKAKKILSGVVIGVFAIPTIALGGSVTISLIQGKSVPEAIQILAQQIDSLVARVEVLETEQSSFGEQQEVLEGKQAKQEQIIQELETAITQQKAERQAELEQGKICQEYEDLLRTTPRMTYYHDLKGNLIPIWKDIKGEYRDPIPGVDAFIAKAQERLPLYPPGLKFRNGDLYRERLEERLEKALQQKPLLESAYKNCNQRFKVPPHQNVPIPPRSPQCSAWDACNKLYLGSPPILY